MQAAATPQVEAALQRALAKESATELHISGYYYRLTENDARRIIECLQQTPRINNLHIHNLSLHDDAVLNVLRDGLPLCTSITTVRLQRVNLSNEDLDRLRLAFYNTSITKLEISNDVEGIEEQHGGEVLRDLLVGNDTLRELDLNYNIYFGPEVAIGIKQGLAVNNRLQILSLDHCQIGNEGLANLLPANDGSINNSVTNLDLAGNNIEGEDSGQQLTLLLLRFPALKVLDLRYNRLGPLGARALALGLAAATCQLETLWLNSCGLGNDGVANLIPNGQVNRSLTNVNLGGDNDIQGEDGGRQVSLLMLRCPVLKVLDLIGNNLGPLGVRALAPGLAAATSLESIHLGNCGLGNDGVSNLVLEGQVNRSLTNLHLGNNGIQGEDGGRQVSLLMLRCPALKVLKLAGNSRLGPLGACALAPGLAAAIHLEELELFYCGLGNDSVANLIPDGQVNRSLTKLDLRGNGIEGAEGGENVVALVARCTNLVSIVVDVADPEQRRRLDMLLDRKRLVTEALALGGSTFPVLFHFVEKAHHHEHGLSAIFVILQNDGDDYFCIALDRAID